MMEAGRKGETWGVWRSVMAPVGHDTPMQGCRWPWPLIQGTAAEWPNFTNSICCRWWAQAPHVSELFEQQFSAVRVRRSFVDFALFITQSSIFSCLCLLFISPFQNLGRDEIFRVFYAIKRSVDIRASNERSSSISSIVAGFLTVTLTAYWPS